jgi:O-antigen/teichoic acid export membrane protein
MNAEVRSDRDHPARATRRVAKNTAYLALADIASKMLGFLFYLLAARRLGVEKFGVLSFAVAFVTMFAVLTDLGLGTVTAREIARDRSVAPRFISNVLAMKLLASVVVILLICALVNLVGYPWTTIRVVYICSFFVLGNAIASYYCWVFQGFERMNFVALTRITQTAVLVAGAIVLLRGNVAVERYALLYVGAGLTSALLAGTIAAVRLVRPGLAFVPREWWSLLRPSLPIGLTVMFTMFYYWNGTTLLSKLRGYEAVGTYSAAFRLAMGFAFAGLAFSGGVFPLFSRLFVSDPARSARALELALRYMMMLTLPVAAFVAVFARPLILLLYGGGYQGAVSLLRILGWWGVCASLNSLLSNFFISVDHPGAVTVQTGLALGVNLVLNLMLIPAIGAVGAAVSIVAAEAVSLFFLVALHLRSPAHVRVRPLLGNALRVVAALSLAVLAAMAVTRWGVAVGLPVGLTLYGLLLFATGGVGKDDWKILRPLLRGGDA